LPLNELAVPERVTGERQVRRKLEAGRLAKLFIAEDADPAMVGPLEAEARRQDIPVERVSDMVRLGRACAISRGASVAGIER
jgi:large subunit ribosomal protein L7A